MKLTYFITACDEEDELKNLLTTLVPTLIEDEIIIQYDTSKVTEGVKSVINSFKEVAPIRSYGYPLNNHFANFKNQLFNYSPIGEYIVQIDADEIPCELFLKYIKNVLIVNDVIDIFAIPRKNKVLGITQEHLKKWGWKMDGFGNINGEDYQWRIFKNGKGIKWMNKVHEKLTNYKTYSYLPPTMFFHHIKTIEKQESQNNFYLNL